MLKCVGLLLVGYVWIDLIFALETKSNGQCSLFVHTGFQLQVFGPIDEGSSQFLTVDSADSCGNACCNLFDGNFICDVAIYVPDNKTCSLINCPSYDIVNGPCRPAKADSESVLDFIENKSSTLIYILNRTNSNQGFVGLDLVQWDALALNSSQLKSIGDSQSQLPVNRIRQNDTEPMQLAPPKNDSISMEDSIVSVALKQSDSFSEAAAENTTLVMLTQLSVTPTPFTTKAVENILRERNDSSALTTTLAKPLSTEQSGSTPTSTTSTATTTTRTTTTPARVTSPTIRSIPVRVEGITEIRLPKNSVVLKAIAEDEPEPGTASDWKWSLINNPEDFNGVGAGLETDTYKLSTLTAGKYTFKVTVTRPGAYGETVVNVTVLEPLRVNKAPVAVITPSLQDVTLPTDSTFFDAGQSHDDVGIVKYEWETISAPLQSELSKGIPLKDGKILQLDNLIVGNYTFLLTVTDTDGAQNSTKATVLVHQKIDNPPHANAGSGQVIKFPQNSATLCGNDSTDDWGIVRYTWSISPDSKKQVVDTQGARSKCLELSNLEVGEYTFQLTVADEANQEASAKVTVVVLPESNHPPVANAGPPQSLFEPLEGDVGVVTLDGSKSTDDKKIASASWKQISGEATTVVSPNAITTTVSGLNKAGVYVYQLTVADAEKESDTAQVQITVKKENPPQANAGPDLEIRLPDDVAILNGSRSSDDYGALTYSWTRDKNSPAIGRVVNNSQSSPVLIVSDLVEGLYVFHLTVTNVRGKTSEPDSARVKVARNPQVDYLVELFLDQSPASFTETLKKNLIAQLRVLVSLAEDDNLVVQSISVDHASGDLVVLFYVKLADGTYKSALEVVELLNQKLESEVKILSFYVKKADTYICENKCSGHGICHTGSKQCECEVFWMENFVRVYLGDGTRNCDWSVLYVIIISFILLVVFSCLMYFVTCFCLRHRKKLKNGKTRKKKQHLNSGTYQKIPSKSQHGVSKLNGVNHHNQFRSTSLMRSMSSSDEDGENHTLFEKRHLLEHRKKRKGRQHKQRAGVSRARGHALVSIEDASESPHSGDSFDGMGLDSGSRVALRGVHNQRLTTDDML